MSCCDDKTQQNKQKSGLQGLLTGPRGLMLAWQWLAALLLAGITWFCWASRLYY
jgi:hypothetical protein